MYLSIHISRVGKAWRTSAVTDEATRRLWVRPPDVAIVEVRVTVFWGVCLHDSEGPSTWLWFFNVKEVIAMLVYS